MTAPEFIERHSVRYIIEEHRHGLMIATNAFQNALQDLSAPPDAFIVRRSGVDAAGGNKTEIANRLDDFLDERGWEEAKVEFKRKMSIVRGRTMRPPSGKMKTQAIWRFRGYIAVTFAEGGESWN
jgi:hypothetical protein